jgi:hypothetical protein
MRTTVTLEPDVARLLEDAVHRERRPFKSVLNDALRRGLLPGGRRKSKPYRVVVHHTALRAGIDPAGFNRLSDELEDASVIRTMNS